MYIIRCSNNIINYYDINLYRRSIFDWFGLHSIKKNKINNNNKKKKHTRTNMYYNNSQTKIKMNNMSARYRLLYLYILRYRYRFYYKEEKIRRNFDI